MREREEYRIAALDMDGTLLNSGHRITPYTREVLTRVAESGKVVALSTGRTLSELWPYLNDMPFVTYVIGENGACLYDVRSGRMLRRYVIEDAEVDFVLELSERYDAVCQAFMEDQSYIRGTLDGTLARYHVLDFIDTFRSGSIVVDDMRAVCRTKRGTVSKINLYFSGEDERADYLRRVAGHRLVLSDSIGLGMEMSPIGATKAGGLQSLCDHLGIPVRQSLAVGDAGNDVEIMEAAGLSVAMANAIEKVRRRADVVTDDCDHDGAAKAVERYMLR